jgi:hypothetical protein
MNRPVSAPARASRSAVDAVEDLQRGLERRHRQHRRGAVQEPLGARGGDVAEVERERAGVPEPAPDRGGGLLVPAAAT